MFLTPTNTPKTALFHHHLCSSHSGHLCFRTNLSWTQRERVKGSSWLGRGCFTVKTTHPNRQWPYLPPASPPDCLIPPLKTFCPSLCSSVPLCKHLRPFTVISDRSWKRGAPIIHTRQAYKNKEGSSRGKDLLIVGDVRATEREWGRQVDVSVRAVINHLNLYLHKHELIKTIFQQLCLCFLLVGRLKEGAKGLPSS